MAVASSVLFIAISPVVVRNLTSLARLGFARGWGDQQRVGGGLWGRKGRGFIVLRVRHDEIVTRFGFGVDVVVKVIPTIFLGAGFDRIPNHAPKEVRTSLEKHGFLLKVLAEFGSACC
jgi:hypothetical protein